MPHLTLRQVPENRASPVLRVWPARATAPERVTLCARPADLAQKWIGCDLLAPSEWIGPLPGGAVAAFGLGALDEAGIEGVAAEGGRVPHHEQVAPGAGEGHVHAAQIREEAQLRLGVVAGEGDEDGVLLAALEGVHGVHLDVRGEGLHA